MNKVTLLCRDNVEKNVIKLMCVSTSLAVSIKVSVATAVSNLKQYKL